MFDHDGRGWLSVSFGGKSHKVHRLVADKFVNNDFCRPAVNHIDCNKSNNRADNLEWVTYQENTDHAKANGLMWYQKRGKQTTT